MPDRPALLFHCQHSLGLGHLVRSFALAEALAERFRVTFLCGGELPSGIRVPDAIELVPLPPLAATVGGKLLSRDPVSSVERALDLRRERVLAAFRSTRPAAIVLELFPFGRRKLAGELVPLLDEALAARPVQPVVTCSVRDMLVRGRDDQESYDERAGSLANRYLDAVLVHADPGFARLEETFRPTTPLRVPVHHTGFVVRSRARPAGGHQHDRRVVVSAGGGRFGAPLFRAALDAHRILATRSRVRTTIVAGPFLPGEEWRGLLDVARELTGVEIRRSVSDLADELAAASVSVSQCGYNTALDILQARVPALVVPFADGGEDEQTRRAERLARLGAVRVASAATLDGRGLAAEVEALLRFRPRPLALDLDGAARSARLLDDLVRSRSVRGAA